MSLLGCGTSRPFVYSQLSSDSPSEASHTSQNSLMAVNPFQYYYTVNPVSFFQFQNKSPLAVRFTGSLNIPTSFSFIVKHLQDCVVQHDGTCTCSISYCKYHAYCHVVGIYDWLVLTVWKIFHIKCDGFNVVFTFICTITLNIQSRAILLSCYRHYIIMSLAVVSFIIGYLSN